MVRTKILTEQEVTELRNWVPEYLTIGDPEHCIYCGEHPNSQDHLIPYSMLWPDRTSGCGRGLKALACSECNGILGGFYFDTLQLRCDYALRRIIRRGRRYFRKSLWTPEETPEEIAELDHSLQWGALEFNGRLERSLRRQQWQHDWRFMEMLEEALKHAKQTHPNNRQLHIFLGDGNKLPSDNTVFNPNLAV